MPRIAVFLASTFGPLFVLWFGGALPETVASHFSVSGAADAHLPRNAFVGFFALLCAVLPTCVWWLQTRAAQHGKAKIPNPSFWFSATEQQRTLQFLNAYAAWFACLLAVFLSYTFWLVVQANSNGASLQMQAFYLGLLAFIVFTAVWLYALHARFDRTDA